MKLCISRRLILLNLHAFKELLRYLNSLILQLSEIDGYWGVTFSQWLFVSYLPYEFHLYIQLLNHFPFWFKFSEVLIILNELSWVSMFCISIYMSVLSISLCFQRFSESCPTGEGNYLHFIVWVRQWDLHIPLQGVCSSVKNHSQIFWPSLLNPHGKKICKETSHLLFCFSR